MEQVAFWSYCVIWLAFSIHESYREGGPGKRYVGTTGCGEGDENIL